VEYLKTGKPALSLVRHTRADPRTVRETAWANVERYFRFCKLHYFFRQEKFAILIICKISSLALPFLKAWPG
jgi:hypothetical protein